MKSGVPHIKITSRRGAARHWGGDACRVTQRRWNAARTHTLKHTPGTQHRDHRRLRVLRSLTFPRLQNTKRLGAEGQKNIVWVSFLLPNGPWEAALSEANRPPYKEWKGGGGGGHWASRLLHTPRQTAHYAIVSRSHKPIADGTIWYFWG